MEEERYDRRIFARNLQRHLNRIEMKPAHLAEYLDVSKSTVSSWLSAQKTPRMDKVSTMAYIFGTTCADLLEEREQPTTTKGDELLAALQSNPTKLMLAEWICRLNEDQLRMVEGILHAVIGKSEE